MGTGQTERQKENSTKMTGITPVQLRAQTPGPYSKEEKMSIIADLPERTKVKIPCGVLLGKNGIVGRYAELHFGRHGYTVYECLFCGREDF